MRVAAALCVLFALPRSALAGEGVEFFAQVDRNEVGTEDTFRLTIVAANAPDSAQPQLPAPRDFEVLSNSQSTQLSYNFGGGGSSVQKVHKYVLVMRAHHAGKLLIPPAVLTTADKTYRTEAIEMTVHAGHVKDPNARSQRQGPFGQMPDPFQGFLRGFPGFPDDDQAEPGFPPDMAIPRSDSDLFFKAMVDKPQAYVGEQITLSLYIFSRVDLSSVDAINMPKLDGFWSEDIESPNQLAAEQKVLNGIPYRAYLLKKRALFPVKAGSFTIGTTGVDITTGFLFAGHRIHRDSNELTLKVKPLPPGAPPGFAANNVGKWRLATEVTQTQIELGQPTTLRVLVEGRGNLKNLTLPQLALPPGLKAYDPTTTDKVTSTHGHYGGTRVQEYLLNALQTGSFTLPGLSLTYFDPETNKYETSKTDPVQLTVHPGAGGGTPVASASGTASGGVKNVLNAGGLKPLRVAAAATGRAEPLWRKRFFLPAAVAPFGLWLALVMGGFVRGALAKEDEGTRKKKKARQARKRLNAAEKLRHSQDVSAFYGEVEKALLTFLEARLGMPVVGLTRDVLAERLQVSGAPPESRARILKVLDTCDLGRFAPGGGADVARGQALDQAEEAMEAWGG